MCLDMIFLSNELCVLLCVGFFFIPELWCWIKLKFNHKQWEILNSSNIYLRIRLTSPIGYVFYIRHFVFLRSMFTCSIQIPVHKWMKSWLVTNVSLNFVPRQNAIRSQDHVNTIPSSSSKYKQRRPLTMNFTEKKNKKNEKWSQIGEIQTSRHSFVTLEKNQFHYKVS